MKDIAEDLGVSLMTVSKALRNHSDISHKTRERVLQRMRELNYQPDWIARSMVTRKTYLVGLVLPDLMHSFFAEIAKGVGSQARSAGLSGRDLEHRRRWRGRAAPHRRAAYAQRWMD
jgi:LacI family transcriptional regulator